MEKLLIVGAGIGQEPLLERARRRGLHVTVVSPPGDYPCLKLADEVCGLDIYDRDAIVEYARAHGITAVTSDQNDLMMPTVAYVAEKLGLPGNRFDQVWAYCNKHLYRENCDRLGNPTPEHTEVLDSRRADLLRHPLPWIVKPEDSQSSIGITRVDTPDELAPAIDLALSKSKTRRAVVEEFFRGHEIVCEGFIVDGRYHLLSFADRKYFALDRMMIPCQTLFPSTVRAEWLARVVEYETRMAAFVHPAFAIVHSEYLVNLESGEIRVVESALRGGGVYISSHLIPLAIGVDINELLLDCVLGDSSRVEPALARRVEAAAGYVCFYLPEGVVESAEGFEAVRALPFVHMAALDSVQPGQTIEKMLHKGMRKGPILVSGKDRSKLDRNILQVQDTLRVFVRTPQGELRGIHWE